LDRSSRFDARRRPNLVSLALLLLLFLGTLQAATGVSILPLGDSITRGDRTADSLNGSYRYYLYTNLTSAGYDVDFVGSTTEPTFTHLVFDQDHDGHGGYTTGMFLSNQGTEPLKTWLDAYEPPDFVLLHIGTNDALYQVNHSTRLENLRTIIGILREAKPKVTILLATIIPTTNAYRNQKQIIPFNAALPALAASCTTADSKVVLVDQYTGFDAATDTLASDGIHPNAEGMKKMAAVWYAALTKFLPPPTPAPAVVAVPGGAGVPNDLDGDGLYEDVNGNRRTDFADATLFFRQVSWIGASEPLKAFDFNANGRIDFADIVRLFQKL
jgi:lysophospholipase L1-like esterase